MLSFFCNFVSSPEEYVAKFRLDYDYGDIDFVSNADKEKCQLSQSQTLVKVAP